MRRLFAAAALGAALTTGGAAHAAPDCVYAGHNDTRVGVCVEYVCVDICAPEYHVDPQCTVDLNPPSILVNYVCWSVDALYVVVP
jgi:hypothetical protein